jgi:ATP-dependent 26S proteasome regulatory subunit
MNFEFWSQEWPLIAAAPHIALFGLVVIIGVVFVIARWGYSREIAGLKAEKSGREAEISALNERLRLAADEQKGLTSHIEKLSVQINTLKRQIETKAEPFALANSTALVTGTMGDVTSANSALANTLNWWRYYTGIINSLENPELRKQLRKTLNKSD